MVKSSIRSWVASLDDPLRDLIAGAGLTLLLRIFGAGIQFGFSIVVARIYAADGLGIFTLSLSITVIASVLARWGMDQTALKLVAIHADRNQWKEVKVIQFKTLGCVVLFSCIITMIALVLVQWLGSRLEQAELGSMVQWLILAVLPFAGLNLLAECLRSVKQVAAYTLIQSVLVPTIATLNIALWNHLGFGLAAAAYSYVIACYATFGGAVYWWRRFLNRQTMARTASGISWKSLLETATPMAWIAIIGTVMSFSETLLLGLFRSSDEVGVYSAALRLAMLLSFLNIAFNAVLAPNFAALIRGHKTELAQGLARKAAVIMLIAALPLVLGFTLFPGYFLWLFGGAFGSGSPALMILALGQFVNVAMGPAGLLLMMGGHEKLLKQFTILAWLSSASLGLVLIPTYGTVGAACSATLGIVMLNLLAVYGVRKSMGIALITWS